MCQPLRVVRHDMGVLPQVLDESASWSHCLSEKRQDAEEERQTAEDQRLHTREYHGMRSGWGTPQSMHSMRRAGSVDTQQDRQ